MTEHYISPEDDDSVAGRLVPREAFNLRMTKMKMLQQSSKILQIEKKRMRKHARCRS
jgi:hypothetical protein